jgi:hypothetical protein
VIFHTYVSLPEGKTVAIGSGCPERHET